MKLKISAVGLLYCIPVYKIKIKRGIGAYLTFYYEKKKNIKKNESILHIY